MHNAGGGSSNGLQQERDRAMRTITLEEHISTPEFLDAMAKVWPGNPVVDMWLAQRNKLFDVGKHRIADMDAAGRSAAHRLPVIRRWASRRPPCAVDVMARTA